jgi:hypothetical protein
MNILLSILGWLAWNVALFSLEKDEFDEQEKPFSLKHYAALYYDNWLLSLVFVPILIIVGIRGLNLSAIPIGDFQDLQWHDMYYLGSGFFAELVKVTIKKLRKKWKSETN